MKIEIIKKCACGAGNFSAGQIVEVPEIYAKALISAKQAKTASKKAGKKTDDPKSVKIDGPEVHK